VRLLDIDIRAREREILSLAPAAIYEILDEDRKYGSPYSFWSAALDYGLITQEEFDLAWSIYDPWKWHQRGD